jgi:hypothetical protein
MHIVKLEQDDSLTHLDESGIEPADGDAMLGSRLAVVRRRTI